MFDLGSGMQRAGAEGGTESIPRKLGEAAVQADSADRGKPVLRAGMAGSNVLTPELWKCCTTAVWQVHRRGRQPRQRDQGKGYCNGVDER